MLESSVGRRFELTQCNQEWNNDSAVRSRKRNHLTWAGQGQGTCCWQLLLLRAPEGAVNGLG